ncbi:MAG: zinc ribbon domain-containing protein [Prevotella sp.]|nr:zinc ribbon domain-containing protein [Prevotella sp.]
MNKNLNRFGISTFSLTFVAKITSKTMDMNSSENNTEGNKMEQNDIKNGKPMPNKDKDEPTLGRGMVAFIVLGTIFLVAFGFIYYAQHKNDPEYTQTAIEPDSNLAETNKAKFDTVAIDTAKTDFTDKLEEKQAEKVYNSIRGRSRLHHNSSHSKSENASTNESEVTETPSTSPNPSPSPSAPKPHVESIEME